MRVLVAEDERITRVTLVRQLQAWGHTVTPTEDGQQALEALGAGEFDVVLTDWEMPRVSGLDLVKTIRAAGNQRFVYIIMLTGRSDKGDLVSGIEAGADDFVAKPFDREELRVRLLAGERIVTLERTLSTQNVELREAGDRMRRDLVAAARVQRAMLPKRTVTTPRLSTAWTYVPTDELAGDAIGLELIHDRYLVTYVADVSGHGVPAALLSVTAMHALSPSVEGLLSGPGGGVQPPSRVVTELNRRFSSTDNDGRFLTMILCVLDTHDGRLTYARAGHPLPIVQRAGGFVPLDDDGGFPLGLVDGAGYDDITITLQSGDRLVLYSDGIPEQTDPPGRVQFGDARFRQRLASLAAAPGNEVGAQVVQSLTEWAGARTFADDVSMVVVDWA